MSKKKQYPHQQEFNVSPKRNTKENSWYRRKK